MDELIKILQGIDAGWLISIIISIIAACLSLIGFMGKYIWETHCKQLTGIKDSVDGVRIELRESNKDMNAIAIRQATNSEKIFEMDYDRKATKKNRDKWQGETDDKLHNLDKRVTVLEGN